MTTISDILPKILHNISREKEDDRAIQASAECTLPVSFIGFQGHFPQEPILPAIVQLALVRILTEIIIGKELIPVQYERTKFKAIVKPDDKLSISVRFARTADKYTGKFKIISEDAATVSSGAFTFIELDGSK